MLTSRHVRINFNDIDTTIHAPVTKTFAVGSKTPGRTVLKSRSGLRENVVGSHTVHRIAINAKGGSPTKARAQKSVNFTRPLGDKTPHQNRQNPLFAPAPQTFKLAKLGLELEDEQEEEQEQEHLDLPLPGAALLRPSSTRKSLRGRVSGGSGSLKPLCFKTPANQGRHWDVSDLDIEVPSENELKEELVEEDDYDEIEYMPPKQPDQPYHPPFEFSLPNYKDLGHKLRSMAQGYHYNGEAALLNSEDIELGEDTKATLVSDMEIMHPSGGYDVMDESFILNPSETNTRSSKPDIGSTRPITRASAARTRSNGTGRRPIQDPRTPFPSRPRSTVNSTGSNSRSTSTKIPAPTTRSQAQAATSLRIAAPVTKSTNSAGRSTTGIPVPRLGPTIKSGASGMVSSKTNDKATSIASDVILVFDSVHQPDMDFQFEL